MASPARPDRTGNLIGGLTLILVGGWFLLDQIGYDLPGLGRLWPLFVVASGLVFIGRWLAGKEADPGVLIPGVSALGIGLFFLAITLGPLDYRDLGSLWPVFPLIAGVAFVVTWVAGKGRDPGLLVPAAAASAVGIIGLMITLGGFRLRWIWQAWPLAVILVGLWILLQGLRPERPRERPGADEPRDRPPAAPDA